MEAPPQWTMAAQPQYAYGAPPPPSQAPYHQPSSHEEIRTLWIGDLPYWADENYLHSWFAPTNEVLSIKVIRNKATGLPEGYGFVEFASHSTAERVLQSYNGTQVPGTELTFRLNWASSGVGERRPDAGPEHSIFVGDLAPDVTDSLLQETFRTQYPSVRGAKVVTDPNTSRSKGYGFVKFADEMERNRAMSEMNGMYCSTRPMRISAATPKKTTAFPAQYVAPKVAGLYTAATIPMDTDPTNTTVYVGNLDPVITEEELRQLFMQFGDIVYTKIPVAKGCGFVQFTARSNPTDPVPQGNLFWPAHFVNSNINYWTSAEEAIQRMHGTQIGQQLVHLSWGKSQTAKQDPNAVWNAQADPNQWGSAYYGYGQGYDPYAYGATQDPSMYAYGAYGGYVQYPQQARRLDQLVITLASGDRGQGFDPHSLQGRRSFSTFGRTGTSLSTLGRGRAVYISTSQPPPYTVKDTGEAGQDMGAVAGVAPAMEQREEVYDPLATPDVDKLNSAYLATHGSAILGRPLWQKTSSLSVQKRAAIRENGLDIDELINAFAEIASEGLKHRVFEISLADLQNDEDHSYKKIHLRAEDVQGKNVLTNFWVFEEVTIQRCDGAELQHQENLDRLGAKYGPWIDTNRVLPLGPRKCKVVFGYFLNDSLKISLRRSFVMAAAPDPYVLISGRLIGWAGSLEFNWSSYHVRIEIGLWIPVKIINDEHDDKPEGDDDFDN
ncbi:polyadenylate-binding protein RBP47B' [Tanacetum coccineum]